MYNKFYFVPVIDIIFFETIELLIFDNFIVLDC